MATYKYDIDATQKAMGFTRSAPFALDKSSYFESLSEAQAAVSTATDHGNTNVNTQYYYGQTISVTIDGIPTIYKVQKAKQVSLDVLIEDVGTNVSYVVRNIKWIDGAPYSAEINGITTLFKNETPLDEDDIIRILETDFHISESESETVTLFVWSKNSSGDIEVDGGKTYSVDMWDNDIPATASNCNYSNLQSGYYGKLVSLEQAGEVGERVLDQAKAYTDEKCQGVVGYVDQTASTTKDYIDTAIDNTNDRIDNLDYSDSEEQNKYVTAVSQTDGKITVTKKSLVLPSKSDTAVDGKYVSAVSQSNGEITVTRTDLPSYSDTAVAKQFVTEVDETKGKISVQRRALESNDLPNVPVTKLIEGANGEKISASLLPSFVDDVIEGYKIDYAFLAGWDPNMDPGITEFRDWDSPLYTNDHSTYYTDPNFYEPFDPSTAYEGNCFFAHIITPNPDSGANESSISVFNDTNDLDSYLVKEPESGKIYVDTEKNKTYRWSGSQYTEISESLALGETASTAYRGDRGKTAYDHATDAGKLTTAQTSKLYKISVTAQGHVGSATEVTSNDLATTLGTALSNKADKVSGATAGDVASLDSNGNPVDSGVSVDDVVTKANSFTSNDIIIGIGENSIAGSGVSIYNIQIKPISGDFTDGHLTKFDSNGAVVDSGIPSTDAVQKSGTLTNGNIVKVDSNGKLVDASISASNIMTKVTGSNNGKVAGLDSNGAVIATSLDAANVLQKSGTLTNGHLVKVNSNGKLEDTGISAANVVTDISGKVDKPNTANENNIAVFDSNRNVVDSNVSKDVLKSASTRQNDSDLGLISKSQLEKVTTTDSSVSGSIAEAKETANKKSQFLGTTSSNITSDYKTKADIVVNGADVKANFGDVAIYSGKEYRWTGATNGWTLMYDSGAQVNVVESVTFAGTNLTISGKNASITKNQALSALGLDNVDPGAQENVIESIKVGTQSFSVGANKEASITAADMRTAINVADGAQVNVVESVSVGSGTTKKTFTQVGSTKEYNVSAADMRTAINVADGAQVNVIETVKVGGTALTVTNKAVDIDNLILDGGSATQTVS